ncbi:hypothetical protein [Curtobacterium sp. MCBD17_026]|uniref:hypothetical protein n=1 Tax=Curtobacterium sp. MCBD17_026 TaxID=2175621 RepID=UPI0011B61A82|nr:hypothetical protein [Curtobacterium sp. MCBD17_026]WIB69769.1 hypothetical protein DEI85_11410 [Curtobacterium sp. MCBD17_026]
MSSWTREQAIEWGARYVFEPLWDTCRRALQAQASMMDFQFDLDTKAPVPVLAVEEETLPESAAVESAT